jgi:hypothetical protein
MQRSQTSLRSHTWQLHRSIFYVEHCGTSDQSFEWSLSNITRHPRRHVGVQLILLRLLRCIQWQPTSGDLFTAQTPLFAVFMAGIVSYQPEHRDVIREWFAPICEESRGVSVTKTSQIVADHSIRTSSPHSAQWNLSGSGLMNEKTGARKTETVSKDMSL